MSISPQTCPIHNFNWESQDRFADFSGDRNPIHMDPIAARRTHAGQPVVHGMHAVLWALERLAHDGEFKRPPSMIKVRFQKLIFVGDTVTLRIVRSDAAGILLHLCVDELSVTSLNIAFGEPKFVEATEKPSNTIPRPEWPEEPIELSLNEIEKMTGWLAFAQSIDVAERVFPAISLAIGPRQVSALACMSRLVGMVCPGLTLDVLRSDDRCGRIAGNAECDPFSSYQRARPIPVGQTKRRRWWVDRYPRKHSPLSSSRTRIVESPRRIGPGR